MANYVSSHPYLKVDTVDLSDKLTECMLDIPQEVKTFVTAESNVAVQPTNKRLTGVKDAKVTGTAMRDRSAGSTNDTLLACRDRNDVVVVYQEVNNGGVPETGNPVFTMTAVMTSGYKLGGKIGEPAEMPFEFMIASGVLDIDITP